MPQAWFLIGFLLSAEPTTGGLLTLDSLAAGVPQSFLSEAACLDYARQGAVIMHPTQLENGGSMAMACVPGVIIDGPK
jgi:hypothetical protein